VPFLSQIVHTEQDWYETFREDIFQKLALHHFVYSRTKRDYWFFVCSHVKNRDINKIIKTLTTILDHFHKWKNYVNACAGIIDILESDNEEENFNQNIDLLLNLVTFDSVWISQRMCFLFQLPITANNLHGLYKYEHSNDRQAEIEYAACICEEKEVQRLHSKLAKWLRKKEKERKVFSVYASSDSGIEEVLAKALSLLSSHQHLAYFRHKPSWCNYAHMYRFLLTGDIEQYFSEVHASELVELQNIVDRLHPRSLKSYSEDTQRDLLYAFRVLLHHILLTHVHSNILFIFEWVDDWDQIEYDTIISLLEEVDQDKKIECILIYDTSKTNNDVRLTSSAVNSSSYHFCGSFNYPAVKAYYGNEIEYKLREVLVMETVSPMVKFSLLLATQYGWLRKRKLSATSWPRALLSIIPRQFLRVLYLIIISYDILFVHEQREIMDGEHASSGQFQYIVKQLIKFRLLVNSENPQPCLPVAAKDIEAFLQNSGNHLKRIVAHYLWEKIQDGIIHPSENFYHTIISWLPPQYQLHMYLRSCEHYLDTLHKFPHAIFEQLPCDVKTISEDERHTFTIVRSLVTHEYRLASNSEIESELTEYLLHATKRRLPLWLYAALYVSLAFDFCERNEKDQALYYAKKVLMMQETPIINRPRAQAFYVMGRLMAMEARYAESKRYYSFAIEKAIAISLYDIALRTAVMLCGQYFITCNLSAAKVLPERFWIIARENGQYAWESIFYFIQARVYFELGQYREARNCFINSGERSKLISHFSMHNTAAIWAIRCLGYLQELKAAQNELNAITDSAEKLYVKAELLLFEKRFSESLECIVHAEKLMRKKTEIRLPYSFSNGFSFIEDMYQETNTLHVAIIVLRACLLFQSGFPSQADHLMKKNTELLNRQEWRNAFYYYTAALLSHRNDPQSGGDVNIISKGVVMMKSHTKYLHNQEDRNAYLYKNYWNNKLMQLAKNYYTT